MKKIIGFVAVLVMVAIVVMLIRNSNKKLKSEYALSGKTKETASSSAK